MAAGETVEITDRGRPVAVLVRAMPPGIARLEREGLLRRADQLPDNDDTLKRGSELLLRADAMRAKYRAAARTLLDR